MGAVCGGDVEMRRVSRAGRRGRAGTSSAKCASRRAGLLQPHSSGVRRRTVNARRVHVNAQLPPVARAARYRRCPEQQSFQLPPRAAGTFGADASVRAAFVRNHSSS
jgi:hypothetical protein